MRSPSTLKIDETTRGPLEQLERPTVSCLRCAVDTVAWSCNEHPRVLRAIECTQQYCRDIRADHICLMDIGNNSRLNLTTNGIDLVIVLNLSRLQGA